MKKLNIPFVVLAGALVLGVLLVTGVVTAQEDDASYDPVNILIPEIISEREHDTGAYTQGLLLYEGSFYESTGRRGESTLREVDPETGEVIRSIDVDETYFAEGLALVDDRLIQLTWTAEVAFVYDLETFELLETLEYSGEGWGLCYDGEYVWMSNGSSRLVARDPETFEIEINLPVFLFDAPIDQLNELECVDDSIYANVWQTDVIVEIDKASGQILSLINASALLTPEERAAMERQAVLNGIAYDPDEEVFYLTGKYWPKLFEVTFMQVDALSYEDLVQ